MFALPVSALSRRLRDEGHAPVTGGANQIGGARIRKAWRRARDDSHPQRCNNTNGAKEFCSLGAANACRLPIGWTVVVSELISSLARSTQNFRTRPIVGLSVLFRRYSIRTQLLFILIALSAIAWLVGGAVTILQARKSTRIEINAAMNLAEGLIRDAIPTVEKSDSPGEALASIPAQLGSIRHIRISVRDTSHLGTASGSPKEIMSQEKVFDIRSPAPGWFVAFIAPPVDTRTVPIISQGRDLGSIVISSAPGDEIAEVWENATALAAAALLIGIASIAILHFLFGRVLAPLKSLADGLLDLGRSDYNVRLPRPRARELAIIAEHFNGLASVLGLMRVENRRLNKRLITAQDDERRQTALDLHDEVGPHLFGLKTNTTLLANTLSGTPLEGRTREMLAMVEGLQSINRGILNRLRPMALGQVPVTELLAALVAERNAQQSPVSFEFFSEGLHPTYGESIDLTLYRCVQESLTNVIRHAKARQSRVSVEHRADRNRGTDPPAWVVLTITDDGCGIDSAVAQGNGIQGMQERVQALGGTFKLKGSASRGTTVHIEIPVLDVASIHALRMSMP
jgi:two-component system, NarL family, sensor histidine kinase UhpB